MEDTPPSVQLGKTNVLSQLALELNTTVIDVSTEIASVIKRKTFSDEPPMLK